MESDLLFSIIVLLALAVIVLYVFKLIKIPAIVGFLLTGIIAGPYGFAVIQSAEQVKSLAEIGVILLLFRIGLEFSFKSLVEIKKTAILGGGVQVFLVMALAVLVAGWMGMPLKNAVFIGFIVSLSSTAIVIKQLEERAEIDSPHGRVALGILIFQDIIVVGMMFITPLLAVDQGISQGLGYVIIKIIGVFIAVILLAKYIVPRILFSVARAGSRELFLLSIMLLCFSIAGLTSISGLSLALGAFLAGLIISESEYSQQALANVLPFIDTFTSLFFISIGMLLNIKFVIANIGIIMIMTIAVLLGKSLAALAATLLLKYPLRIAIVVGLALSQVGEFSFILAGTGYNFNLISAGLYQGFLAVAIMTMMLTPFLITAAPRIANILAARFPAGETDTEPVDPGLSNHVIIIGYGINGRNLSRAAAYAGIAYSVLEINADTVKKEKGKGEPIYYGDATYETVLKKVNLEKARVVVVAISDAAASRRIVQTARRTNPSIYLIVRSRYIADVEDLYRLGADEVIPEEYETSVEIFARVMARYLIPRDEIEGFIEQVRLEDYQMFRKVSKNTLKMHHLGTALSDVDIAAIKVGNDSQIAGKKLEQIDLRNSLGLSVLALRRGQEIISNPGAEDYVQAGDYMIILGKVEQIREGIRLITG